MVNINPDEKPIAQCYINKDGDERNACFLTSQRFIVKRWNKFHEFPIEHLATISVRQKQMLFPIVFGGIIFSLSTVALSTNYYNPYLTLLGILLGLGLLYWGFTGMKALSVLETKAETNFFLFTHAESLEAFLLFANNYIRGPNTPLEFYLMLPEDSSSPIPSGTRLYLYKEIESVGDAKRMIKIEPGRSNISIKYLLDESVGKYVPTVEFDIDIKDLNMGD